MSWRKTRKVRNFSIPLKREVTKMDKNGNGSVKTMFYKLKLIGSARFMASWLSNPYDNLTEGIHEIKCKDCDCFLECESLMKIQ